MKFFKFRVYFIFIIASLLQQNATAQVGKKDYATLMEQLSELNQRYLTESLDSILLDIQSLINSVDSSKTHLNERNWQMLSGETHFLAGHIYSLFSKYDEATSFYLSAADFYTKCQCFKSYFMAMANALKNKFANESPKTYLKELDYHFQLAATADTTLFKSTKAEYLMFRFNSLENDIEKLETIEVLDNIFEDTDNQSPGIIKFRFYADALLYAYESSRQELIDRFLPKYALEVKRLNISSNAQTWYEGHFAFNDKDYDKARKSLVKLLGMNPKVKLTTKALAMLFKIEKEVGDFEKALFYYDTLVKIEKEQDLNQKKLMSDYLFVQRNNERLSKEKLETELEKARYSSQLKVGASFLLLLLLITSFLIFRNRKLALEKKLKQIELEKNSLEFYRLNHKLTLSSAILLQRAGQSMNQQKKEHSINELGIYYDQRLINKLQQYPEITARDVKMACFIAAGLDNHQLQDIFQISAHSIRVAKSRLKKKLNLTKDIDLYKWLSDLNS